MIAVLSGLASACRSTQLYEAFSLPPTNHLAKGAFDQSSTSSNSASIARHERMSLGS